MTIPRPWWRNQLAVTVASFIGFTGFTLVMPFLPLYFRELGVRDTGEIALWSGLSLGITPALTALLAPLWGRLADRFGRKIMVERSLLSFVVVMAATAYVTRAWHVFALRAVHGFFAGYGGLTLAMAAESAPRDRMATAIGFVQAAQRLGPALGPVIGGAVAQLVGLRNAFLVAAAFFAMAFLLVLVLYHEPTGPPAPAEAGDPRLTFRRLAAMRHFLLFMTVVFAYQFVDRSFGPILPLYVAGVGVPLSRVPLVSGVVFSIAAGTGAVGNQLAAGLLARHGSRAVLTASAVAAAVAAAVLGVSTTLVAVLAAASVFGLAVGVGITTAYTLAGRVIPSGAHGAGFGYLTSASLAGLALSPFVAGAVGAAHIRAVFVLDGILLVGLAGLIWRQTSRPAARRRAPVSPRV